MDSVLDASVKKGMHIFFTLRSVPSVATEVICGDPDGPGHAPPYLGVSQHFIPKDSSMRYATISLLLTLIASMSAVEIENLAPPEVQNIYMTLIAATSENNLEKFHSVCDQTLRAALTKEKLKTVSESFVKNWKNGDD